MYEREVGQYYRGQLYRTDLLPVPDYVLRCLRAQQRAGKEALVNFLDGSYLGDGVTSLRAHLERELAQLAQLEPETARAERAGSKGPAAGSKGPAAGSRGGPGAGSRGVVEERPVAELEGDGKGSGAAAVVWPAEELAAFLSK